MTVVIGRIPEAPSIVVLEYDRTALNEMVDLLSLYEAKTLRDKLGLAQYEDMATSADDYEVLLQYYKDIFNELTAWLSTVSYQTRLSSFFDLPQPESNSLCEFNIDLSLMQANMINVLDNNIDSVLKNYALFRWFLTVNNSTSVAEKYNLLYQQAFENVKSNIRHQNDKTKRPTRRYNLI